MVREEFSASANAAALNADERHVDSVRRGSAHHACDNQCAASGAEAPGKKGPGSARLKACPFKTSATANKTAATINAKPQQLSSGVFLR